MASNLLMINLTAGQSFTIPEGFLWASIKPSSGATYTITNGLAVDMAGISLKTSPAIEEVFTFGPQPSLGAFKEHTIAATGGAVLVVYTNGN